MSPFNVDSTSKIGAVVFSTIVTRHPLRMLSLSVVIQGWLGWFADSTNVANIRRVALALMLSVHRPTAEGVAALVAHNLDVVLCEHVSLFSRP